MKSKIPASIDDILFENRNKEYGSYRLRKQYYGRLAIGFLISVATILLLVLSYSWYLNSAGDATIYYYTSSQPNLKSTQGSLLSPRELKSLGNTNPPKEKKVDNNTKQPTNILHNFTVTDKADPDTFRPAAETNVQAEVMTDPGLSNDSTIFGGFLLGNGENGSFGSNLDRFPEFPGGPEGVRRYIEMNVQYPVQAIKQKIHGVVLVSFDVNKLGTVDNIKIERSINPIIDAEAIKAIEAMPRWKPGMRYGRPVIVKFVIPVNFMPVS